MTPTTPKDLIRGTVPHPAEPGRSIAFFGNWERAVRHLIDHVLTAPECAAWAVVVPGLADHVDPADGLSRVGFAERAWKSQGASAQALFDLYRGEAAAASRQAHALGWHAADSTCSVALGTAGVLVLVEGGVVATVYIPGQGSAAAVHASQTGTASALTRERRLMRRESAPREERQRRRREEAWSPEEHLYHRVFRPAIQFIRGRYHLAYGLDGRVRHADALLKPRLPRMSELGIDSWHTFREQASAGGPR